MGTALGRPTWTRRSRSLRRRSRSDFAGWSSVCRRTSTVLASSEKCLRSTGLLRIGTQHILSCLLIKTGDSANVLTTRGTYRQGEQYVARQGEQMGRRRHFEFCHVSVGWLPFFMEPDRARPSITIFVFCHRLLFFQLTRWLICCRISVAMRHFSRKGEMANRSVDHEHEQSVVSCARRISEVWGNGRKAFRGWKRWIGEPRKHLFI